MGELPCRACQLAGKECIYIDPGPKTLVSDRYLQELERRSREWEIKNQAPGSVAGMLVAPEIDRSVSASSSANANADAESEDIDDSWIDGMNKIVLSPSGAQRTHSPHRYSFRGV